MTSVEDFSFRKGFLTRTGKVKGCGGWACERKQGCKVALRATSHHVPTLRFVIQARGSEAEQHASPCDRKSIRIRLRHAHIHRLITFPFLAPVQSSPSLNFYLVPVPSLFLPSNFALLYSLAFSYYL